MPTGVERAGAVVSGLLLSALVACEPAVQSNTNSRTPTATATTNSTSSATPHGTTSIGTGLQWTEVGSFGEGEAAEFASAVVHRASGFVAVGTHYDQGLGNVGPLPPHEGRVWVSPDGRSWANVTPPDTFADAVLEHVFTTADDSIIAIGRITVAPGSDPSEGDLEPLAAWESADGLSWRRVDSGLPADLTAHAVEHGARGYLAALSSQLWLSADGRRWEQVYVGAYDEPIQDIGAGDEGFVAVGSRPQGDSWAAFVVASSDGRDWVEASSPPINASQVAPLGPDWIASASGDYELRASAVWFSPNGLDWSEIATISLETIGSGADTTCQEIAGSLHEAAGWLVVGSAFSFPCSEGGVVTYGRTLVSLDGRSWRPLPFAEQDVIVYGTNRGSVVLAAIGANGKIVLVGHSNGRATFWLGESP